MHGGVIELTKVRVYKVNNIEKNRGFSTNSGVYSHSFSVGCLTVISLSGTVAFRLPPVTATVDQELEVIYLSVFELNLFR